MRNIRVATIAAVVVAVFIAGVGLSNAQQAAPAKGPSYLGNATCKMCHSGAAKGEIYEKWVSTGHSKAFAKLPDASKKDPKCFACHTTGAGKAGGYDPAAKNAATLEGVTCEACHGPASDYKTPHMKDKAKAMTLGMTAPNEALCKTCHAGAVPEGHKALPKFEFAAAKAKIEHHLPAKK